MAFSVLAYRPNSTTGVAVPRWDRVSATEGSGLGVADAVQVAGSDPEWGDLLMETYDRLAVLEDLGADTVAYGPFDITTVDQTGEHLGWVANGVKNYYWEQQLADTDQSVQESVLAEIAGAFDRYAAYPPISGWDSELRAYIRSLLDEGVQGATGWDELVSAVERWGLTMFSERSWPDHAARAMAIPRYPLEGGPAAPTAARLGSGSAAPALIEGRYTLDEDSVQIRLVERANPPGGWSNRRIVSTDRNFVNADVTSYSSGTRPPTHFLDLAATGLAAASADLARWQMQNECLRLDATLALPPEGVMANLAPHQLFEARDRTWRLVGVTRTQAGLRRTVELEAMLWQGFFQQPAPLFARDLDVV